MKIAVSAGYWSAGPALIGPWAKIADEIQRWKHTVLTTFSVHCDPRHLEKVAALVR